MSYELQLPAIQFSHSEQFQFQSPSLTIDSKILFLIGPNGSGKSSFLRALNASNLDLLLLPAQQDLSQDTYVNELFEIYNTPNELESKLWEKYFHKDSYVSNLSSGELQRLFLHLHCNNSKNIQALDEPTNFLDPYYKYQLAKEIKNQSSRKHFIIATHDLNWAAQFSNAYFLLFHNAKISNQGLCKNIVESLEMQKAFQMRFRLTDNLNIEVQPLSD